MAGKKVKRDADISKKSAIEEKLLDVLKDVEKGYADQKDRTNEILDNWDLYNCQISDKQYYNGTSQIFLPFVRDAVNARVTRFVNQLFPQSGRYVEVTTGDADLPQATMALLEHYVRRAKLRTEVAPALLRNGDMEGQYTIYVDWRETTRHAVQKESKPVKTDGMEQPDLGTVEDVVELDVVDARPGVEIISDPDLLVLPATCDSIEEALAEGGSVTILRRWSKARIKKAVADGDIRKELGDDLIEEMRNAAKDPNKDVAKENASAAGIKSGGKVMSLYETWTMLKVDDELRLCRAYLGGEKQILGCKLNPFWNDRCPVISAPVIKIAGVFKGQPPVTTVSDLQIAANDTINEALDTAHFSAMPIVMTDPLKNPRVGTMVLGLAAVWETSPSDTQFAQFPDLWRTGMERASAIKDQIFQTLSVNPSMIPQSSGTGKKRNQAEIANEQQVDLMTTADSVTIVEGGVFSPMLSRFAEYDHQFRDEEITVSVYGDMGLRANMEEIPPIQLNKRYEYRWYGVENARNAAQVQQQIAGLNVLKGMPPQSYPDYDLDCAPMLAQLSENLFGPRLGPLTFKRKRVYSVDPEQEDMMLVEGFITPVSPADDDAQHMQIHIQAMQAVGDPHGTFRDHISKHQQQMQMKAMQAQGMKPAGGGPGAPGGPGGAGPGVAGTPEPGSQPMAPKGENQPPGALHKDRMPAAGAVTVPRKM